MIKLTKLKPIVFNNGHLDKLPDTQSQLHNDWNCGPLLSHLQKQVGQPPFLQSSSPIFKLEKRDTYMLTVGHTCNHSTVSTN